MEHSSVHELNSYNSIRLMWSTASELGLVFKFLGLLTVSTLRSRVGLFYHILLQHVPGTQIFRLTWLGSHCRMHAQAVAIIFSIFKLFQLFSVLVKQTFYFIYHFLLQLFKWSFLLCYYSHINVFCKLFPWNTKLQSKVDYFTWPTCILKVILPQLFLDGV